MPAFYAALVFALFTFIGVPFEEVLHPLILGLTALGTVGSLALSSKIFGTKTEFEIRQEQTLKIIQFLIRERKAHNS